MLSCNYLHSHYRFNIQLLHNLQQLARAGGGQNAYNIPTQNTTLPINETLYWFLRKYRVALFLVLHSYSLAIYELQRLIHI
jgi:hypothetical protein